MREYLFHTVLVMLLTSSAVWAQSESEKRVSQKTDWAVFVDGNPKDCWAVSVPDRPSLNTKDKRVVSVKRGKIMLMVTYRPSQKIIGQLAFTGGYPFAPDRTVTLDIDGKKFELRPGIQQIESEWAWTESPEEDQKVVAAMKRGKAAILTGQSKRSTITKDTFSLLGFTAAVDDAAKRCSN